MLPNLNQVTSAEQAPPWPSPRKLSAATFDDLCLPRCRSSASFGKGIRRFGGSHGFGFGIPTARVHDGSQPRKHCSLTLFSKGTSTDFSALHRYNLLNCYIPKFLGPVLCFFINKLISHLICLFICLFVLFLLFFFKKKKV